MKIFLHGSRRNVAGMPEPASLLERIASISSGPLLVSAPLLEALRGICPGCIVSRARAVAPGQPFEADLAISLGGDGTFLRTAQWVADKRIPILGINAGHLGYLADLTPGEFISTGVDNLKVEPRALLRVDVFGALPDGCWPYALNDVALLKTDSASMISIRATIDGAPLTTYQADGLVVSTPTGSTGYNLSVGGPILEPSVRAVILSPVAPHALTMRPLVVADSSVVELTVGSRSDSWLLSLDGRSVPMSAGESVRVTLASFPILVAQRPDHHFAATLRTKLLWGERSAHQ